MRETDPLLGHRNGANGESSSSASAQSRWTLFKSKLDETIDVDKCNPILTIQCFIAGAADAAAYGQTSTWAAFMTGNITQLSMSAVNLLCTHPLPAEAVMRLSQSSSAIFGFITGSFIASLIDKRFHSKHRGKMAGASLVRSIIFVFAALFIAFFGWDGFKGMGLLFVLAACMGTMAVNSSRLNTPYATSVVFTASLASVFSDPSLPFSFGSASKTRGISIISLITGGASAQAVGILVTRMMTPEHALSLKAVAPIGSAVAIGLAALADFISAFLWLRASVAHE
ncbi:hypothetical protein CBS101457_003270 [Exobasidium rhododendri]|nr:hypothetical protein CBS101457_003270 [Exobasidium rhododendri]